MNKDLTFERIRLEHEAEPNMAVPEVNVLESDIVLSFDVEGQNNYSEIEFKDCLMYRVGSPNDEGFYSSDQHPKINNSVYSHQNFPNLQFGYFYKVTGLNWRQNKLGEGTLVLNDHPGNDGGYSHFVFFMKDGTFECVAKDWVLKK